MNKIHTIQQTQLLPVPVAEAWSFFSSPTNLNKLTPPKLGLVITSVIDSSEIYTGQIITYTVKPLLGIPLFWKTEITEVKRHQMFVDEQRKGPYALWHHEHYFKEVSGGTEMRDIVQYKIPFGALGAMGTPVVQRELKNIFDYRRQQINAIFGNFQSRSE